MQFNAMSLQLTQDSAITLPFPVNTDAGIAIDVSSGYDARLVVYSLNQPDRAGHIYETTPTDFTYGDGTVTLPLTFTQINGMHSGTYGYQLNISDDAFATDNNLIAAGQVQVVPSAFAL